ncbi:MAG: metallophosphoesterase family protein [Pseudomonadota bacterium]
MSLQIHPRPADEPAPILVAIGDVHGRLDLLQSLIEKLDKKLKNASVQYIFLGDYIDRGPNSAGVIDFLLRFQSDHPDTIFLKGNHEEAMLDFLAVGEEADGWLYWGGEQTLESYGIDPQLSSADLAITQELLADVLPPEHFSFLMDLKLLHEDDGYLFVHAGLDPLTKVDEQKAKDLLWIRDAFTEGGEGKFPDHVIVHGHTPVKRPENKGWRINIDTGAVWSSKLTAVLLGKGQKPKFVST